MSSFYELQVTPHQSTVRWGTRARIAQILPCVIRQRFWVPVEHAEHEAQPRGHLRRRYSSSAAPARYRVRPTASPSPFAAREGIERPSQHLQTAA